MIALVGMFWLLGILGSLRCVQGSLSAEELTSDEFRHLRHLVLVLCCLWPLALAVVPVVVVIRGINEAL